MCLKYIFIKYIENAKKFPLIAVFRYKLTDSNGNFQK